MSRLVRDRAAGTDDLVELVDGNVADRPMYALCHECLAPSPLFTAATIHTGPQAVGWAGELRTDAAGSSWFTVLWCPAHAITRGGPNPHAEATRTAVAELAARQAASL